MIPINHAIIIPSLNPGAELIPLVDSLTTLGADKIVVINDGSDASYSHIFKQLKTRHNVTVLEHKINLGKGAALKTAFCFCLLRFPGLEGIITADGDGQHAPGDIMRVSRALSQNPEDIVLGIRQFDKSNTPKRSGIGNKVTSIGLKLFFNITLPDSQTGLRGIPAAYLKWMSKIRGSRYDYEINMLIQSHCKNINIRQIPIEIIYFDNNSGSHFKTVPDAARIFKILLYNLFRRSDGGGQFYGLIYRIARGFMRLINIRKKFTVAGETPPRPAVFVGHHQNMRGVVTTLMWLKLPLHTWWLSVFCEKKTCYKQYSQYTFTRRMGKNKYYAKAAAYALSLIIPPFSRSLRAIPVHRSTKDLLNVTINRSVQALCTCENLLIYPDIDYTSTSPKITQIYDGFIDLDKFYNKKTGGHIAFVPLRLDFENKKIIIGKASYIQDNEIFDEAKKRVSQELTQRINGEN